MLLAILVALLAAAPGDSLRIKVIEQDLESGLVVLLLPMHHTEIAAVYASREQQQTLKLGEFYRSKVVPGELETVSRNRLIVQTKSGPVVLIIHTIRFR